MSDPKPLSHGKDLVDSILKQLAEHVGKREMVERLCRLLGTNLVAETSREALKGKRNTKELRELWYGSDPPPEMDLDYRRQRNASFG